MDNQKKSIAFEAPPIFPTGKVVITGNAMGQLPPDDVRSAIERHRRGDWGMVSEEDWQQNEMALELGERLLSAYQSSAGEKFWVITERDRSCTTILMPEDY